MASGVNVKMGVSGVQQFKQGIKESQAAVKNLDQQLKLNEQQLKLNGDAEVYLQNKTKLLEEQIKKQQDVVRQSQAALESMRKNGVAETSTAFQNMQANVYKASSDLMAMRTELQNIDTEGSNASVGVEELNTELQNVGKGISWQNVTGGIEKITGSLEKAAKKALEVGKNITREVLGAGSWADDLHTRATYFGLSDEELQRMEKTSGLVDTSVDAIVNAQKKLRKGIGSADTGVMGAYAALIGEGYDPKAEGWENAFWDAGDALMRMSDAEEKEVYAQKLFGRSWNELIPLFETGREEYEKLNASWNVVSDENLKSLQEMYDQYQKLSNEFETFKMSFLATLAESLTPLMETLTGMMEKFNEYLASPEGQAAMEKLGEAIEKMFEDLTNADPEQIIENLSGIFDKIQGGLQWLIDNKDTVVNALKVIVGGFALLKLAGLAANIGQIVSGLKGLGTGAASSGIGKAISGGATGSATGSAAAAGQSASISSILSGMFGAGSGFSMMGGLATFGPLAALGAAGAAGAAMINANLNDVNLNKIYGDNGGEGGLVDTMTPEQWQMAAKYFSMYELGGEAAMTAREDLFTSLENGGFVNAEQGVSLLENAFENYLNETDPDGLVAKITEAHPEVFDRMTAVAGETTEAVTGSTQATVLMTEALKGLETLPESLQTAVENAVISGMSSVTIVMDQSAVDALNTRMIGGLGNRVKDMVR